MMREHKKKIFCLGLSLFFHTVIVLFFGRLNPGGKSLKNQLHQIQWLELISDQRIKRNQIVEQEKNPIQETAPHKDYRLSQTNRNPLKETRAKKSGVFKNGKGETELLNSLKPRLFSVDPKSVLSVKNKDTSHFFKNVKYSDSPGSHLSGQGQSTALFRTVVSQTDDYLKNVVSGSETLLRTREFVYYSYYNRIKRKLRQYWKPKVKMKIKRALTKGRKIARIGDRVTCLAITLNSSGELVRIRLQLSSGFTDLDHSAIEAFKEASPFPNPPKGLVNQYGEIKINWNFILES